MRFDDWPFLWGFVILALMLAIPYFTFPASPKRRRPSDDDQQEPQ